MPRIDESRLRDLLAAAAGVAPAELDGWPGRAGWLDRAAAMLTDYVAGVPLGYVLGEIHYLGRAFRSDRRALAVRRYSEPLVRRIVDDFAGEPVRAVEIGCGAAAAICTLAKELTGEFVGTDVVPEALELAEENATRHRAPVRFVVSDLFDALDGRFDVIYANLPRHHPSTPMPEARWEPSVALYDDSAEPFGLLRRFFAEVPDRLTERGRLYLEIPLDPAIADLLPGEPVVDGDGDDFARVITAADARRLPALVDRLTWPEG
ncbi:methyltransferase domain-containing protein [Streptoalloteichus hindustanus]|uniref:Putative N-methyltransferase n=1 Tax=Streptoalloteichus hindustanus TaxID=2017 RepID=Q2MEX7_STRHI|nr:methyltransferase domain-containing protein [Streptoalloteichus hindustanus]CAI47647.1 putative N-methyltransferase [Streptoalloteichus hindustanus]SHG39107.1 ribosomal protein L3 glutamine methyltransferase [Streptoalloteichus hindustanus]